MEQILKEGQRTGGPGRSRSTKCRTVRYKIRHSSRIIRGELKLQKKGYLNAELTELYRKQLDNLDLNFVTKVVVYKHNVLSTKQLSHVSFLGKKGK